jgi:hypothetical protein
VKITPGAYLPERFVDKLFAESSGETDKIRPLITDGAVGRSATSSLSSACNRARKPLPAIGRDAGMFWYGCFPLRRPIRVISRDVSTLPATGIHLSATCLETRYAQTASAYRHTPDTNLPVP